MAAVIIRQAVHPRIRFVETTIGSARWMADLALNRPADVVVSSTALHYPAHSVLARIYRDAVELLGTEGVLVNGDHLAQADESVDAIATAVARAAHDRDDPLPAEDWESWWRSIRNDPTFAGLVRRRARVISVPAGDNGLTVQDHSGLLRAAGFRSVGTVWQRGNSIVLVAAIN